MILLFRTREIIRLTDALAEAIRLEALCTCDMPNEFRVVWRHRPSYGAWPYLEV